MTVASIFWVAFDVTPSVVEPLSRLMHGTGLTTHRVQFDVVANKHDRPKGTGQRDSYGFWESHVAVDFAEWDCDVAWLGMVSYGIRFGIVFFQKAFAFALA